MTKYEFVKKKSKVGACKLIILKGLNVKLNHSYTPRTLIPLAF